MTEPLIPVGGSTALHACRDWIRITGLAAIAACLAACSTEDMTPDPTGVSGLESSSGVSGEEAEGSSTTTAPGGTSTSTSGVDDASTGEPSNPSEPESESEEGPHGVHYTCVFGEEPDPRDAQITDEPDEWVASNGDIDLVVPAAVVDWMTERSWQPSHDAWHNIRRCGGGGFPGGGGGGICNQQVVPVPENQECENAGDGYEFLAMHRHMMQALRQAFPTHTSHFEGFPTFPFDATEVPEQWRSRWGTGWTQQIIQTAQVLENIEGNLGQFADEGELGRYMQCGGMASGASSIHGALHFKWVVMESPHSLGSQPVNIDNYMFWKLHGWIDNIWERYRVAKGLAPDQPELVEEIVRQCHQMHDLAIAIDPDTDPPEPLPEEHGFFHEQVRPIFESNTYLCAGCHGANSPQGNLALGGHISSADIVAGLVNQQAFHGGQFKLVEPGAPERSWLYLKASNGAVSAGCQGSCNTQVMPQGGLVSVSEADLAIIRQWILDGAPPP